MATPPPAATLEEEEESNSTSSVQQPASSSSSEVRNAVRVACSLLDLREQAGPLLDAYIYIYIYNMATIPNLIPSRSHLILILTAAEPP